MPNFGAQTSDALPQVEHAAPLEQYPPIVAFEAAEVQLASELHCSLLEHTEHARDVKLHVPLIASAGATSALAAGDDEPGDGAGVCPGVGAGLPGAGGGDGGGVAPPFAGGVWQCEPL